MPSRRVLFLVLTLATVTTAPSLAQNRYFADGVDGITLQGGWVTADEASGIGGAAVLTFDGRFDVGGSYLAPEMEIEGGSTQEWEQITPRLAISLVRPREGVPVGIDVAASYTSIKFGGALQDLVGGDAQTFGVDVYGRFGSKPAVRFIPTFGIHYRKTESWYRENIDSSKRTMDESGLQIGVECALVLYERFFVVPGTVAFEGETTWSIMGGFSLAMK